MAAMTADAFCCRNMGRILELRGTSINESVIPQHVNATQVTAEEYQQLYETIKGFQGSQFKELGLESCNIETELNKVGAKGVPPRLN